MDNKQCKRWRAAVEHVTTHPVREAHSEHHVGPPQVVSLSGLFELRHTRSCSPAQRSNDKLMVVAVRVVKGNGVPLSCKVDQLLISGVIAGTQVAKVLRSLRTTRSQISNSVVKN